MKTIDWNKMSELNLISHINKEILHPLGLAICRNTKTGESPYVAVAEDGEWEYEEGTDTSINKDSIKEFVSEFNKNR